MLISHEELLSRLNYNPETGVFTYNNPISQRCKSGDEAGHISEYGYRLINIDGRQYHASRLAWFYVHGYWSENQIDHKNRVRDDNRLCNLREASPSCNSRNKGIYKTNKSGVSGVCWMKAEQKWHARISVNRKRVHLGFYENILSAAKARWLAEVKYNYPNCNTASSAREYIKEHDPSFLYRHDS